MQEKYVGSGLTLHALRHSVWIGLNSIRIGRPRRPRIYHLVSAEITMDLNHPTSQLANMSNRQSIAVGAEVDPRPPFLLVNPPHPRRQRRVLAILPRASAAFCSLILATAAFAEPCAPEKENFIDFVTGGDECLALEVHNRHVLKKPGVNLVIGVHGDAGPGSMRKLIKTLGVRESQDSAAISIIRPGHETVYNNYASGVAEKRISTGYRPQYGSDSYSSKNIEAVMLAIARLRKHYKPQRMVAIGISGGSAILGAGIGLFPELAPEANILASYPCDLGSWASSGGWTPSYVSVSPSSVYKNIPEHIKTILVAAHNDTNIRPDMIKQCAKDLRDAGKDVSYIEVADADHDRLHAANELRAAIMETLATLPATPIYAQDSAPATGKVPAP